MHRGWRRASRDDRDRSRATLVVTRSPADRSPALAATGVTVRFGGLTALSDVSIEVEPGTDRRPRRSQRRRQVDAARGAVRVAAARTAGRVRLRGEDVTNASPRARASRGLARTFQQPELFLGLTVREHLVLAYRARVAPSRLWRDMFDPRSLFPPSAEENEQVDGILELLRLTRVAKAPVAALPLGVARLVEVGRALASDPHVLLLDEPLSGLDMKASENLLAVFTQIVEQADHPLSLIIVEHDVAAVLALSRHGLRARLRRAHRGRHPGGDPQRSRRPGRLPGRQRSPGEVDSRRGAAGARAFMTEPILEVRDLDVRYGSSQALFGVSLTVQPGTVLAVLGANGAGKSTLARAVSGLVAPTAGKVFFEGRDVTGLPAHRIRQLGLTYIPEGRGIFPGLSVIDNLRMAVAQERRQDRAGAIDRAIDRFPVLGQRSTQRAGSLSGGEQQMLALARALAVSPKLVIADEMSLGLAPLVAESVFEGLEEARRSGITIVLSEQFVHRALAMADSCVILTRGRVGWSGPASEAGQEVIDRYLGEAGRGDPRWRYERVTVTSPRSRAIRAFAEGSQARFAYSPAASTKGPRGVGPGRECRTCNQRDESMRLHRRRHADAVLAAAVVGLPLALVATTTAPARPHRRRRSPSPTSPT